MLAAARTSGWNQVWGMTLVAVAVLAARPTGRAACDPEVSGYRGSS
jgi:hypothetical protein